MCSASTCRLCAVPESRHLGSTPHLFLIEALEGDGKGGEWWIVPRRHVVSCLETRAKEWLEVPVLLELAQQARSEETASRAYRIEIREPAGDATAPPHLCIRLILDPHPLPDAT